jgi:fatty-acyl-CoA synthase
MHDLVIRAGTVVDGTGAPPRTDDHPRGAMAMNSIDDAPAPSIASLLAARASDPRPGLHGDDRTWTWAEVVTESASRARLLNELGLAGRHLGVLLENTPEYVFLLYAAALTGSVVVGINPTQRGDALAHDIRHTECAAVFTDDLGAALLAGLDLNIATIRVDEPAWTEHVTGHAETDLPEQLPGPDALLLLIFTSGSTGAPKAVRMSQGRAIAQMAGAAAVYAPTDVLYSAMPMFHANALTGSLFPALASGAAVVLKRRFSASAFVGDIRRYGCTSFNYVGQTLAYILAQPPTELDADNALTFCVGAEASPRDRKEFRRRFGCYVVEGYTSSEGGVSINPFKGMPEEALGRPADGMDLAIVDPDNGKERPVARFDEHHQLLNPGEAVGEIVRRDAAASFEGYHANPEADARRTRNGWIWSGDLGYRDEEGTFYFAGRGNDWLRVDGENFAAGPVEAILRRHPSIAAAVAYAVPDPRVGDRVMVALQLRPGTSLDGDDLARFLAAQPDLGTKMAPHFVRIVAAIPLTGTGKVDRNPLRVVAWMTSDRLLWRPGRELAYQSMTAADVDAFGCEFEAAGRRHLLPRRRSSEGAPNG